MSLLKKYLFSGKSLIVSTAYTMLRKWSKGPGIDFSPNHPYVGCMLVKRPTILILSVIVMFCLLPASVTARGRKEKKENSVARVNGEYISQQRYDLLADQKKQQYGLQGTELNEEQQNMLKEEVMNDLVTEEILFQEAQRLDITAEKKEINAQLDALKQRYQDENSFKEAIAQNGFTEKAFKQYIERNITIQKLLEQEVGSNITIEDSEMKSFYADNPSYFEVPEQIEARHILVSTEGLEGEGAKEEARSRAESIRRELLDGADFAALAREKSEGPSASNGGSLGRFSKGQMVPSFEEVAFSLEIGEISEVVETQFGYHIIEVTDKISAGTLSYEEAKPNIEEYLTQVKQQEQYTEFIENLREQAEVEYL